jgi:hypothetical protein
MRVSAAICPVEVGSLRNEMLLVVRLFSTVGRKSTERRCSGGLEHHVAVYHAAL